MEPKIPKVEAASVKYPTTETVSGLRAAAIRIVNFSHPLTAEQVAAVEGLTAATVADVLAVPTHFGLDRSFAEQATAAVEAVGLTADEWQTTRVAIVAPALAAIACVVIAEIHGRAGYFVPVIRLRPRAGVMPPAFEVAEILDLQGQRDSARSRR